MKRRLTSPGPALLALSSALLVALPAAAKIDVMYVTHTSGPALCNNFTTNNIDYGQFLSNDHRIPVPRGTKIRVTLMGFGADLATGTEDNVTNLGSSIVAHGTTDKPGGGVHFGQRDQTGYVRVEIRAHDDAELGNGHVTVKWLTGSERIPLKIVASCNPTPPPAPPPAGGGNPPPPPPRIVSGGSSTPALPDLIPTEFVNFRTCNASSFGTCVPGPNDCNGAFTGQRKFTQPDLQYGVRNISNVAVTTPFAVVLKKKDGSTLATNPVPNLAANGSATFTFHRANSDVCVQQIGPNKVCTYCAVAIDDTGIEVVVDSNNAITEVSETNNSRKVP
ncbi:MAG: hypothetical protein NEA02_11310 [Thermoanaerobaculia bacterium]|nr:hypothetical protein [Thermoanaerobaculia bacterium]